MRARIYADRFYVLADHPGISGFQEWDKLAYCVVTGAKAKQRRPCVVGEFLPISEDVYRCEDGHIPDYQPRLRTPDALRWLLDNPFAAIVRLDPATRSKDVAPHYQEARPANV